MLTHVRDTAEKRTLDKMGVRSLLSCLVKYEITFTNFRLVGIKPY